MEFSLARDVKEKIRFQKNLKNLDVHKSMGPADMHPLVLRELASEVA